MRQRPGTRPALSLPPSACHGAAPQARSQPATAPQRLAPFRQLQVIEHMEQQLVGEGLDARLGRHTACEWTERSAGEQSASGGARARSPAPITGRCRLPWSHLPHLLLPAVQHGRGGGCARSGRLKPSAWTALRELDVWGVTAGTGRVRRSSGGAPPPPGGGGATQHSGAAARRGASRPAGLRTCLALPLPPACTGRRGTSHMAVSGTWGCSTSHCIRRSGDWAALGALAPPCSQRSSPRALKPTQLGCPAHTRCLAVRGAGGPEASQPRSRTCMQMLPSHGRRAVGAARGELQ